MPIQNNAHGLLTQSDEKKFPKRLLIISCKCIITSTYVNLNINICNEALAREEKVYVLCCLSQHKTSQLQMIMKTDLR